MTQNEWKNIFGDNLASILREQRMTQTELARITGISPAMISDYVNKRSIPGLMAAINIAYALDMDVDELVNFDEPIEY